MKVSYIIALGALVLNGFIYMKMGRKPVFWLLLIVFFAAVGMSIFSRLANRPNATIINVYGNVTIINPGTTPDAVQQSLSDAAAAMDPSQIGRASCRER